MKKTNFPVAKTFEQDFLNSKSKKLFTLRYKQWTISEYYEYINKSPQEQTMELYNIITKSIKHSLKTKIIRLFNKNYISKLERWLNLDEILVSIFQNRYRAHLSIFNEVRKSWWKGSIESVWLSAICKTYMISPTDLMKNYTLEQYFWFLDGVEWINNSMDKEWETINKMAIIDKEAVAKRAEENKKAFDKIRKK